MSAPSFATEQIIDRLELLWRKLEDEGFYVDANTVALAIAEIKRFKSDRAYTIGFSDGWDSANGDNQ